MCFSLKVYRIGKKIFQLHEDKERKTGKYTQFSSLGRYAKKKLSMTTVNAKLSSRLLVKNLLAQWESWRRKSKIAKTFGDNFSEKLDLVDLVKNLSTQTRDKRRK